jgi:pimeloyl-ACP methyl ester carboxylesterase
MSIEFVTLATAHGTEQLELLHIGPERVGTPIVFLHEGLGSVAAWRDFPRRLCELLNARGIVYSRRGYGQSDPLPAPRSTDYLHREAHVVLPGLLAQLKLDAPLLVGHSDGGSIALLYAAQHDPAAVAVMAPHVLVEEVTLDGIRVARAAWNAGGPSNKLRDALARVHTDASSAFFGWNDAWLAPPFAHWNIEAEIESVRCPVLAMQGADDQYGTMEQLDRIARRVQGPCTLLKLDRCGHSPQSDQPEVVSAAIEALYRGLALCVLQ